MFRAVISEAVRPMGRSMTVPANTSDAEEDDPAGQSLDNRMDDPWTDKPSVRLPICWAKQGNLDLVRSTLSRNSELFS